MHHAQLWAPWRLGYIKDAGPKPAPRPLPLLPGADEGCFLCRAVADAADRENLVVARGAHSFVILNRYPYNNGHLLVACREHLARLDQLPPDAQLEMLQTIECFVALLERTMNAEGFNIGINLGRVAGAGVPGHLHWHIVPRWSGDTNFMPALAGVDVIPQALEALWELLTTEGARHGAAPP